MSKPTRRQAKASAAQFKQRMHRFQLWQAEAAVHNCAEHAVRGDDGVWECDECGAELKTARLAL